MKFLFPKRSCSSHSDRLRKLHENIKEIVKDDAVLRYGEMKSASTIPQMPRGVRDDDDVFMVLEVSGTNELKDQIVVLVAKHFEAQKVRVTHAHHSTVHYIDQVERDPLGGAGYAVVDSLTKTITEVLWGKVTYEVLAERNREALGRLIFHGLSNQDKSRVIADNYRDAEGSYFSPSHASEIKGREGVRVLNKRAQCCHRYNQGTMGGDPLPPCSNCPFDTHPAFQDQSRVIVEAPVCYAIVSMSTGEIIGTQHGNVLDFQCAMNQLRGGVSFRAIFERDRAFDFDHLTPEQEAEILAREEIVIDNVGKQ